MVWPMEFVHKKKSLFEEVGFSVQAIVMKVASIVIHNNLGN